MCSTVQGVADGKHLWSALVTPRLFLTDAPVRLDDDSDAFSHADYAAAVTVALQQAQPPWTLGLFGSWGTGKTTILDEVRTRLVADGVAVVTFDAWHHDEPRPLRRAFITEVATTLAADKRLGDFDVRKELRDLDVDRQEATPRLRPAAADVWRFLLLTLVLGIVLFVATRLTIVHDSAASSARKNMASLIFSLVTVVITLVGGMLRVRTDVMTYKRVEEPDRFRELFERVVSQLTTARLVIVVDNLDRCTAAETVTVLSTIKTFMQPVAEGTGKDVVFLIAADRDALRRHLLSKERDAFAPGEEGEAAAYVDEYLRKAFSATMTIHPPLPSELRDYVAAQIGRMQVGQDLSNSDRLRLVELVAAGMRANPRGVVQFLNNLQLRVLLVIQRRSGARLIQGSGDGVLQIAKLAVIEHEWPAEHQLLTAAPQLLDEWTASAQDRGAGLDDRLAAFLRSTADIAVGNPRALLLTKVDEDERSLAQYRRFWQHVTNFERDETTTLLNEVPNAGAYAAALPRMFSRERAASFLSGARSIVDAVVMVPGLGGPPGGEVLRLAINDPGFRSELRALPLEPLLTTAHELASGEAPRLVDLLVADLVDPARTPAGRQEIATALRDSRSALSPANVKALFEAFGVGPMSEDLTSVAALAAIDPGVVHPAVVDRVLSPALHDQPWALQAIVTPEAREVMVAAATLPWRFPDLAGQLGTALTKVAEYSGVLMEGQFAAAEAARRRWFPEPGMLPWPTLEALLSVTPRLPEDERVEWIGGLTDEILTLAEEERRLAVGVVLAVATKAGPEVVAAVVRRLGPLVTLLGDAALSDLAQSRIAQGDTETVRLLVDTGENVVVNALVTLAETSVVELSALERVVDVLRPEGLEWLGAMLAAAVESSMPDSTPAAAVGLGALVQDRTRVRNRTVDIALQRLTENAGHKDLYEVLVGSQDRLFSDQFDLLMEQIARLSTLNHDWPLTWLTRLEPRTARQHQVLDKLIAAEAAQRS